MADKNVKITFEVDGIKQTVNSVEDLEAALKDAGNAAKDTAKETKDLADEQGFIGERIQGLKDTFGKLKTDFKGATRGIKTFFKSGVTGSKLLKAGLASLGIGLLITAVASLVSYFQNFEVVTRTVQKALNGLGAIFGQLGKSFAALIKGDFKGAANAFTDIGSAVNEAVQATDDLFDAQKRLNSIQQRNAIEAATLRQEIEGYKKILEDTTQTEEDRLAALDEVTKRTKELAQLQLEENQAAIDGLEAQIALTNNEVERRDLELELAQLRAERIDQQTELNNIEFDAAKVGREIVQARLDEEEAAREAEAEAAAKKAEEEKAAKDKAAEEDAARQAELNQALADLDEEALLASIDNEFRRAEEELRILEEKELERLRILGASEEELTKVTDKFTKQREKLAKDEADYKEELDKAEFDNKVQLASQAFGAVASLLGENTAAGKAAAIAATTIDTYVAAQKAYTSQLTLDPTSPVRAAIAAGVAVAGGLANVRAILSTPVPGGEGGAGGAAPRIPSAPTFDPGAAAAATGTDQDVDFQIGPGESAGTGNNGVIKAYVVSTELTTQQEADKKINDLAKL